MKIPMPKPHPNIPGQQTFDDLVVFHDDECVCPPGHPPAAHDDGFGCTMPAYPPDDDRFDPRQLCPCTAGWGFDE